MLVLRRRWRRPERGGKRDFRKFSIALGFPSGAQPRLSNPVGFNKVAELDVAFRTFVRFFEGCADDLVNIAIGSSIETTPEASTVACAAATTTVRFALVASA